MEERLGEIIHYLNLLEVHVDEDDIEMDLDDIADSVSESFWDEMYEDGDYTTARNNANEVIGDRLVELPYIKKRIKENEDWDESENYDAFREILTEEVFDRAGVPSDEIATEELIRRDKIEDENI